MTSQSNKQEDTETYQSELLAGRAYFCAVATLAFASAVLILLTLYDIFFSTFTSSHGWQGTSEGVLGGLIGAFVFVGSKTVDHEALGLTPVGRGRPTKEHVAYLRTRLIVSVPSGFVMSTLAAAMVHTLSPALLTAFGILGGFSCTLLASLTHAAEAALVAYVCRLGQTQVAGEQLSGRHREKVALTGPKGAIKTSQRSNMQSARVAKVQLEKRNKENTLVG